MDLVVLNPKNPEVYTRIGPERGRTGPVLITNPEACRYVRIHLHGSVNFDRFMREFERYRLNLFEFYHTGDHISLIVKGRKLPSQFEEFLVRRGGCEVTETPAYFFQVVGYMTRADVVAFNGFLAKRQHLSGPRWFEDSRSMNVCLPEEDTDIGAVLQEIHREFIAK